MQNNANYYDHDVIIIGSGMGGLAAGNILVKKGYNVLIIEKHSKPGGYCTNFKRKDYIFDSSLHMLNGCEKGGTLYSILKKFEAENCVEFIKLKEMFYWKCPPKDIELKASSNLYEFIDQLMHLFPHEAINIKKFYEKYLKVVNFMLKWNFKGAFGKFLAVLRYFRSLFHVLKILNATVSDILDPYISDPICKNLITALGGFFGLGPDEMSACIFLVGTFLYFTEGAYYPKGGSGAFSEALANIFVKNGGDLLLSNEVLDINFNGKLISGVTFIDRNKNKKSLKSRVIIANCDITKLVTDLCPPNTLPKEYVKKIKARKPGFSAVCIYLGLNLDLNKRGFKDYELWISNEINTPSTKEMREIAYNLDFSKFFSTSATIYSNIDPSCCPKGKTVLSTIFYATPEPFLKLIEMDNGKRGENYNRVKKEIGQLFVQKLAKALGIVDLEDYIEVMEIATPITLMRYTFNRSGSFIGWEMTPNQMLLNQIPQKTPVQNLFLAGAWAMPAGGVSTVLISGDTCSKAVNNYLKKN